jgi:hypothetical protein
MASRSRVQAAAIRACFTTLAREKSPHLARRAGWALLVALCETQSAHPQGPGRVG